MLVNSIHPLCWAGIIAWRSSLEGQEQVNINMLNTEMDTQDDQAKNGRDGWWGESNFRWGWPEISSDWLLDLHQE